ncbi:MAG: isochorismatase family protein [Pirellulaceae bacterium]
MLEERRLRKVIVMGLATDFCVKATALDAIACGFEVFAKLRSSSRQSATRRRARKRPANGSRRYHVAARIAELAPAGGENFDAIGVLLV